MKNTGSFSSSYSFALHKNNWTATKNYFANTPAAAIEYGFTLSYWFITPWDLQRLSASSKDMKRHRVELCQYHKFCGVLIRKPRVCFQLPSQSSHFQRALYSLQRAGCIQVLYATKIWEKLVFTCIIVTRKL